MEKIFLMIGREKMANTCPHRAESMEHSVKSFYPMPYALCDLLVGVSDEDLSDGWLRVHWK